MDEISHVLLTGSLEADPVIQEQTASFRLIVRHDPALLDGQETSSFPIEANGVLAGFCANLRQGQRVQVEGCLYSDPTDEYDEETGELIYLARVIAESIELLAG